MVEIPISGRSVISAEVDFSARLFLDRDFVIQIEDGFEIIQNGTRHTVIPASGADQSMRLAQLLVGRAVTAASYSTRYDLDVELSGGVALRVVPNREGFESWQVAGPGFTVVGNFEFG